MTELDLSYQYNLVRLECDFTNVDHIDMRNGNNHNIVLFNATNNNALNCISVDDELADHSTWQTDAGVIFSNDCGYNTQRGVMVMVSPRDPATKKNPVDVTFDKVELSGQTTLEITNTIEDPGDISFPDDPTVYNIETTAEVTGPIEIAIDYSEEGFDNEEGLSLLHYEDGEWINVTKSIDIDNDNITGEVLSLSPFVIIEDIEPPEIFCPDDVTLEYGEDTSPATTGEAVATDLVDRDVDITFTDEVIPGNCGCQYIIHRTWTATDDYNNFSACLQTITIVDTQTPVIVGVPDNPLIYENAPGQCGAIVEYQQISATDNCGGEVHFQ